MNIHDFLASNYATKMTFISGNYEVRLVKDSVSKHNLLDGAWTYEVRLVKDSVSKHNLLDGAWTVIQNEDEIDDINSNEIYIKTKKDKRKIMFTYSGKVIIH